MTNCKRCSTTHSLLVRSMKELLVTTSGQNQVLDITDTINLTLPKDFSGIVFLNLLHTTGAITTADLDPGTGEDLLDAIKNIVPNLPYRHPHNPNPEHVGDHIMSSLIGTSLSLHCKNGELYLGKWQRVVLIELDGPRKRQIIISLIKESL